MPSGIDLNELLGGALIVYCYARIQWQRDYVRTISFSLLNLIAGLLMLVTIYHQWNPIFFAFDFTWLAISYYGLYRNIKYIRLQREQKRWIARRIKRR